MYTVSIIIASILIAGCEVSPDAPPEVPMPEKKFSFEAGDYKGLWNSNTATKNFKDLPISTRVIKNSDGTYKGEFFISANFTSCCNSGENDGDITFKVEDNMVTDFVWNDIIPSCNGTFIGSGTLVENNSIKITIKGKDCDGYHTGAIILLKN